MKKVIGVGLIGIGLLSFIPATLNARQAPNPSYFIGTLLPGLLLVIFGVALCREKREQVSEVPPENAQEPAILEAGLRSAQFKSRANWKVTGGILTLIMGIGIIQQGPDSLLFGTAVWLGGLALIISGCVEYMRWKGYSGWFGLFGYLLLPGLLILCCFPNRRKRLSQKDGAASHAELERLLEGDKQSGKRFHLSLIPLVILYVVLAGFLLSAQSNVDSAEWTMVAPAGAGFQALMPGTPQMEKQERETPAGVIEMHKVTVHPKGKDEAFVVVSTMFPEEIAAELGGTAKLLELGRQDLLTSCKGQLRSEKQVVLGGWAGLELEVLPPKGAIVRGYIYATKTHIFQVLVHVPQIRLSSDDVQKFFNSFKLST